MLDIGRMRIHCDTYKSCSRRCIILFPMQFVLGKKQPRCTISDTGIRNLPPTPCWRNPCV